MPRQIDLDDEIARLEEAIADDPNTPRQYVTKLPAKLAIKFIRDCQEKDLVIANNLLGIVEQHFDQKERGFVGGAPPVRRSGAGGSVLSNRPDGGSDHHQPARNSRNDSTGEDCESA